MGFSQIFGDCSSSFVWSYFIVIPEEVDLWKLVDWNDEITHLWRFYGLNSTNPCCLMQLFRTFI